MFNIGMHIGGGPNDDVTKEPIAKSVSPHFAAIAACFAELPQKKETDVGVDLLVPAGGGAAQVSHPRSTAKDGAAFLPCIVKIFEGITFLAPRGGRTVVSYSLRYAP